MLMAPPGVPLHVSVSQEKLSTLLHKEYMQSSFLTEADSSYVNLHRADQARQEVRHRTTQLELLTNNNWMEQNVGESQWDALGGPC